MNKYLQGLLSAGVITVVGLGVIQVHEGYVPKVYKDPAGIPTVCWGHTGSDVKLGETWTRDRCEETLGRDIVVHRQGVLACTKAPLNKNQLDAVVSFTFNVGVKNYCNSTMARKINARDYYGAANEFPKWKYATVNGKATVLPGLVKRREAERALFLKEVK